MTRKKKGVILKDQSKLASPLDERDDRDLFIGQPGYRTRRGRSGLDYIESQAEFGHSLGYFIQRLFTLKLRVQRPFSLLMLGVFGLLLTLPGILIFIGLLSGPQSGLSILTGGIGRNPGFSALSGGLTGLFIIGLTALIGILVLLNLCSSLYRLFTKKQKHKAWF
jgi:hypothetical protein